MRFASLQSSNTGDYAAAGKAAADTAVNVFATQRKSGPDYGKLSQIAMVTNAEEKIASMQASAKVTNAGVSAFAKVTQVANNEKANKKVREIKNSGRKAGVIAGLGKMAAAGYLASRDNTKGREYPTGNSRELWENWRKQRDGIKARHDAERDANGEYTPEPVNFSSTGTSGDGSGKVTGGSNSSPNQGVSGTVLTGNRKIVADAIAGPESGSWGYEAFNQGGSHGGTRVVGKSGSHKEIFGRSLSDMTLSEIFQKQNMGGSDSEFRANGGLHAVGRYQFIGSTLQDEVRRMGLDPNTTKFTPQVQDDIFFNHIKRVGSIQPWVGPSTQWTQQKKNEINALIPTL